MSNFSSYALVMLPFLVASAVILTGSFRAIHREDNRRKELKTQ